MFGLTHQSLLACGWSGPFAATRLVFPALPPSRAGAQWLNGSSFSGYSYGLAEDFHLASFEMYRAVTITGFAFGVNGRTHRMLFGILIVYGKSGVVPCD